MRSSGANAPRQAADMESLLVVRADNGKPLQDFLAARFSLSRRAAKALIDARSVWVNRRCVWIAHHALKTGDRVEVPRRTVKTAHAQSKAAASAAAPAERTHVRVLMETPDYVVADKPAGIVVCGEAKSVESILRVQLGEPNLQAVHRLDRDTTGCLLFARRFAGFQAAVEVFKTHGVAKTYYAIAVGKFEHAHELIESPIDGQRAVSRVTREAVGDEASFLRVKIDTGRTNQIRRHLSSIRHPVVGDRMFGLKSARDARLMTVPRQMLHAATLELPDPMRKGEKIRAHSPLPADFRAALRLFGMGR